MPEFISKLQYKTYEDSEYSDEKARNPEETIELIKNFPWAIEQYADLGLTGPSITILDENSNYLKAGIYYGGKYSLYYLDARNLYYEKRNINIDVVCDAVNDFFEGKINLQNFTKENFAFGTQKLFATNQFEYRIKLWKVLLLSAMWLFYFLMFLAFSFVSNVLKPIEPIGIFLLFVMVLFAWPLVKIMSAYLQKKKQYLKISRGNDIFFFGDGKSDIKAYSKNDIAKIVHYENDGIRSPNAFEIFEVIFRDNSYITFTNMLISYSTFTYKFSGKWKLDPEVIRQSAFKITQSL